MATKRKQETNVQFMKRIMEFSRYGALSQLFIMDALKKHADHIANMPYAEFKAQFGDNALVNANAWQGVAKEIAQEFELHYSKR